MRLLIDTDPAMGTLGGDPEDSFAIMLAINSPEVNVEGITIVQGNVPAEKGYSNVSHLLTLLDRKDSPLRRGCQRPLNAESSVQVKWLEQRYSAIQITEMLDPQGPDADAVGFMVDLVLSNPGEITLLTIGPLTNVATAIAQSAGFAAAVKDIVMMGGTAACAGNISPAAEFNFWQDPEAADIVFNSGAPLTMVGLDVCHQTHLYPKDVDEAAKGGTALGRFVKESTAPWFQVMSGSGGSEALHLYDSLAAAVVIEPDIITTEDSHVAIETGDGPAEGMSVSYHKAFQRIVFQRPNINAKVATEVNIDRFNSLFQERVLDRIAGK